MNRLDAKYKTALEKASYLEKAVSQLEVKIAVSNSDRVQLREVEREARTNLAIYENFLRRSKKATEQIDNPSSTARIISPANSASTPSHPADLLLLACALVFGLVLGVIAAFLDRVLFGQSELARESNDATIKSADFSMFEQPYRYSSRIAIFYVRYPTSYIESRPSCFVLHRISRRNRLAGAER